jgi:outer membrane protein OmpA-like peptidoglycan-associated protein
MKIKTAPKVVLAAVVFGGLFFGLRFAASHGILPSNLGKILVPTKAVLPSVEDAKLSNVTPVAYPTDSPVNVASTLIRGEIWEWNAQMGLIYANGGSQTTKGSLMAKRQVNLNLARQDDTGKMTEDLIACAKEIHDGATQCSNGANFVIIMGDGAGQFAAAANPQLKKLGPDYGLKVIGAVGYSRGEDAFMAPPAVKQSPQAAKGLLVEGVLRDGDWNIALKWEGDNNIPNNPDEKTYDANAVNWVNAPDYNTAAADYVAGKCEDRKVVSNGHLTGETKHVCVNAVVTWTPGDVTAAEKKGGLVKVVSSKEYRSQMPSVIIGPSHFFNQNREEVQNMLAAIFEGGDQVKAFDKSLHIAADISAKLYADQNGAYWFKYYKGTEETDAQGLKVSLGGSTVNNLADNKILFGLDPGSNNNFASTYNVFSKIDVQQYPEIFKVTPIPDVKDVQDKSYIIGAEAALANNDVQTAAADTQDFSNSSNFSGETVSHRSYSINFDTGKATPTSDGLATLSELKDSLAITGLKIKVDGFTDDTGSAQINTALSSARADAVKSYLQRVAPKSFPSARFSSVQGHGPDNPVASNSTESGKAQNRRVEISLQE